jgi:hypothetical protein
MRDDLAPDPLPVGAESEPPEAVLRELRKEIADGRIDIRNLAARNTCR